jgi:hypothetical protein
MNNNLHYDLKIKSMHFEYTLFMRMPVYMQACLELSCVIKVWYMHITKNIYTG